MRSEQPGAQQEPERAGRAAADGVAVYRVRDQVSIGAVVGVSDQNERDHEVFVRAIPTGVSRPRQVSDQRVRVTCSHAQALMAPLPLPSGSCRRHSRAAGAAPPPRSAALAAFRGVGVGAMRVVRKRG
jgi:hypothetical protein